MSAFADTSGFAKLYPEQPGIVKHGLVGHPLFTLDALVGLAGRMAPGDIEYNRGDLPQGIDLEDIPSNDLSITDTISGIQQNSSWMVLKFVEQDAAYRDLLVKALAELGVEICAKTGPMLNQNAFIFVSSPNAVTPLHFDPEHNILLQLRGTKTMTVFPAHDEQIAPPSAHERLHLGQGHRNLPWDDRYTPSGQRFELGAGEGVYVPLMAPHWVQNGTEVSISFSITWRSAHSYAEAEARGMNAILRRAGFSPKSPPRYPARNFIKSLGYRAIRKVNHLLAR